MSGQHTIESCITIVRVIFFLRHRQQDAVGSPEQVGCVVELC